MTLKFFHISVSVFAIPFRVETRDINAKLIQRFGLKDNVSLAVFRTRSYNVRADLTL